LVRDADLAADPKYTEAMQRVTRRVEQLEAHLKELGTTPAGLAKRRALYKDLVEITGPRRELILSTDAARRR